MCIWNEIKINRSDDLFIYTHLTDIDWTDKFYTSPNCTNKICVWNPTRVLGWYLAYTNHNCLVICQSIGWQTVVSVKYLYLMLIQCRMHFGWWLIAYHGCCIHVLYEIHINNIIWWLTVSDSSCERMNILK